MQTEALRTAAWWLHGLEYPEKELGEIWKDHLFNDFHDILPGTCVEPAEQDALKMYGRAEESRVDCDWARPFVMHNGFPSKMLTCR